MGRYIFHENGKKVESTHDLEKEEIVYVSTGEPFLDPDGAIEDWIAVKTRGHVPPTSADDLLARHRVRLLKARVNGQPRPEAIITAHLEGVYSAEQAWELMLEVGACVCFFFVLFFPFPVMRGALESPFVFFFYYHFCR